MRLTLVVAVVAVLAVPGSAPGDFLSSVSTGIPGTRNRAEAAPVHIPRIPYGLTGTGSM